MERSLFCSLLKQKIRLQKGLVFLAEAGLISKMLFSAKGGAVPATTAVGIALGTLIGGGVFLIIFFTGGLAAVPVAIVGTIGTVSGGVGAAIGGVSGFLVSTSCVPACRNSKTEAQDGFFKVVASLQELTKEQKEKIIKKYPQVLPMVTHLNSIDLSNNNELKLQENLKMKF